MDADEYSACEGCGMGNNPLTVKGLNGEFWSIVTSEIMMTGSCLLNECERITLMLYIFIYTV